MYQFQTHVNASSRLYLIPRGISYGGGCIEGRIVMEEYSVVRAEYDLEKPKQDWPFRHLRLALERPAWSSTIRDCKNVWVVIELSDKFTDARPAHMLQNVRGLLYPFREY